MRVFIGADHRGFELKEGLLVWIKGLGYELVDCGAYEYVKTDDYVDFSAKVASEVVKNKEDRGVVICGSGVGVEIVVGKVAGVLSGLGISAEQVTAARRDDNINVLALAADYVSEEEAKEMVKAFLETKFSGEERHVRRLEKIIALEGRKHPD